MYIYFSHQEERTAWIKAIETAPRDPDPLYDEGIFLHDQVHYYILGFNTFSPRAIAISYVC